MRSLLVVLLLIVFASADSSSSAESTLRFVLGEKAGRDEIASRLKAEPLAVGESRFIHHDASGLTTNYLLQRDGEKSYTVTFPLHFQGQSKDVDENKKLEATMSDRVQGCLALVKPMDGPQGEELRLKAAVDVSAVPEDGYHTVKVTPAGEVRAGHTAADRDSYPANVNCGLILHELFHLTGLVDEYSDSTYACRVDSSAITSLMKSPDTARVHQNMISYTRRTCSCAEADKACRLHLQEWFQRTEIKKSKADNSTECPEDALSTEEYAPLPAEKIVEGKQRTYLSQLSVQTTRIMYDSLGAWVGPLLLPGEFNAVVYPGDARNLDFYLCARLAYRKDCGEIPAACADGNTEWLMRKFR